MFYHCWARLKPHWTIYRPVFISINYLIAKKVQNLLIQYLLSYNFTPIKSCRMLTGFDAAQFRNPYPAYWSYQYAKNISSYWDPAANFCSVTLNDSTGFYRFSWLLKRVFIFFYSCKQFLLCHCRFEVLVIIWVTGHSLTIFKFLFF